MGKRMDLLWPLRHSDDSVHVFADPLNTNEDVPNRTLPATLSGPKEAAQCVIESSVL